MRSATRCRRGTERGARFLNLPPRSVVGGGGLSAGRAVEEREVLMAGNTGCSMEDDSLAERIVRRKVSSEDSLLVAQGEDGLCRRRMGCRWGWRAEARLAIHATWELQVAARAVHVVSMLRPQTAMFAAARGARLRCACAPAWHGPATCSAVSLVRLLLASPLPSLGCGSSVPNSLICSPVGARGQPLLSLER